MTPESPVEAEAARDERFLRRAIELSRWSADQGGGPFGAVVAQGDSVVGEGWNQVVETSDPTAHAEVVAIRAACRAMGTHVLAGCVLYASCEPCPMCLGASLWARLDRVACAADRRDAAEVGFDDARFHDEVQAVAGCAVVRKVARMREEARSVLVHWAALEDRREY